MANDSVTDPVRKSGVAPFLAKAVGIVLILVLAGLLVLWGV